MKGVFLLDIEIELAWGFIDQEFDKKRMTKAARRIRQQLRKILTILEGHQIPVTWGVVGHAILDRCERAARPHPEMPRPVYKWLKRDWYEPDPCSSIQEDPAFYGKDIIDQVVDFASKAIATHDIACHSFSHQLFGDEGCTEDIAQAEVKECLRIMKANYNITPSVFIFPRDFPGHLEVLSKNGFVAYRGRIPHSIDYPETDFGLRGSIQKYVSLGTYWASFYLRVPPPVVDPSTRDELVCIPASLCYNKKPYIPLDLVTKKAIKGVEKAAEENKIFHLYTHDINFGEAPHPEAFLKGFDKILRHVSTLRDAGKIETTTIKDLAKSYKNMSLSSPCGISNIT